MYYYGSGCLKLVYVFRSTEYYVNQLWCVHLSSIINSASSRIIVFAEIQIQLLIYIFHIRIKDDITFAA